MKKGMFIITTVIIFSSVVHADAVFIPPDPDILDLDHYYAYKWGFDLGFSTADTPITEATLTFTDIYNWRIENDHLYIHLLDDARLGLRALWDGQGGGDYFDGQGVLLINWNDPAEWDKTKDLVITFNADQLAALNAFGADGRIGFGFDPDCHYYNKGISFRIVTAAVPAPGAIMLGTVGLMFVGWLRRRKTI